MRAAAGRFEGSHAAARLDDLRIPPAVVSEREETWDFPCLPAQATGSHGSANTKMLLPLLGRSSGVIALQREALPPVPVPATTYWRPAAA